LVLAIRVTPFDIDHILLVTGDDERDRWGRRSLGRNFDANGRGLSGTGSYAGIDQ
jgi:hypothetical protein